MPEWIKPTSSGSFGAEPIDEEVNWDKTRVIMSETDKNGTITNVNQVFVDVCGYSATELIGQPHNIIRHPDMPKIIFKALWNNLQQGNNFIGIVKNKAKSGKYYWIVTDFEIIKDEEGNVHRYIARRKSVPQRVIDKHIQPLYETLLKLENVGGMDLSNRYFKGFLEKQGKSYFEYVMEIMEENEALNTLDFQMDNKQKEDVSDDVYSIKGEDEVKRKSFFARLFS